MSFRAAGETRGIKEAKRVFAMKWIDLPPVWLALFLALVWAVDRLIPLPVLGAARVLGAGVALAGAVLMMVAILTMSRARTTVIPHRQPQALVTGGVFGVSRNPIYLADVLILTGAVLWWDALHALPLVALFSWIITRRFILPEEARLRAGFGDAFVDWSARVRRWM